MLEEKAQQLEAFLADLGIRWKRHLRPHDEDMRRTLQSFARDVCRTMGIPEDKLAGVANALPNAGLYEVAKAQAKQIAAVGEALLGEVYASIARHRGPGSKLRILDRHYPGFIGSLGYAFSSLVLLCEIAHDLSTGARNTEHLLALRADHAKRVRDALNDQEGRYDGRDIDLSTNLVSNNDARRHLRSIVGNRFEKALPAFLAQVTGREFSEVTLQRHSTDGFLPARFLSHPQRREIAAECSLESLGSYESLLEGEGGNRALQLIRLMQSPQRRPQATNELSQILKQHDFHDPQDPIHVRVLTKVNSRLSCFNIGWREYNTIAAIQDRRSHTPQREAASEMQTDESAATDEDTEVSVEPASGALATGVNSSRPPRRSNEDEPEEPLESDDDESDDLSPEGPADQDLPNLGAEAAAFMKLRPRDQLLVAMYQCRLGWKPLHGIRQRLVYAVVGNRARDMITNGMTPEAAQQAAGSVCKILEASIPALFEPGPHGVDKRKIFAEFFQALAAHWSRYGDEIEGDALPQFKLRQAQAGHLTLAQADYAALNQWEAQLIVACQGLGALQHVIDLEHRVDLDTIEQGEFEEQVRTLACSNQLLISLYVTRFAYELGTGARHQVAYAVAANSARVMVEAGLSAQRAADDACAKLENCLPSLFVPTDLGSKKRATLVRTLSGLARAWERQGRSTQSLLADLPRFQLAETLDLDQQGQDRLAAWVSRLRTACENSEVLRQFVEAEVGAEGL